MKNFSFWYRSTLFIFVCLAGFRWRVGGDTINYLYAFYYNVPYIWDFSIDDFFFSRQEPLFLLLNVVVKSLGGHFWWVQIVQALIVNILIFNFFRKHSSCFFTCISLYFIWFYSFLNFEEMRAGISVVICLYANDYILDKKYVNGMLLYFMAGLFHFSAIILIITPLFLFLRLNTIGIIIIAFSLIIAFFIQQQLGDYLFLFEINDTMHSKMAAHIINEEYFSQVLNVKGIIGSKLPYIFYAILTIVYFKKRKFSVNNIMHIMQYEPFVLLGVMWVLISIFMPLLNRYVRFYQIYFVLFLATYVINNIKSCNFAVFRTCVLMLPFSYLIYSQYFHVVNDDNVKSPMKNYVKYHPYSSVFDMTIGVEREKSLADDRPNVNQY